MTSKLKSTSKRSQRFPNRGVALWARFPPVKKPGENKKKAKSKIILTPGEDNHCVSKNVFVLFFQHVFLQVGIKQVIR